MKKVTSAAKGSTKAANLSEKALASEVGAVAQSAKVGKVQHERSVKKVAASSVDTEFSKMLEDVAAEEGGSSGSGGGIGTTPLILGGLALAGGAAALAAGGGDDNKLPVAASDTASATENVALTGSVKANDSDPDGDTLTYAKAAGQADIAGFTFNSDGSYTFTPTGGEYESLAQGAQLVKTFKYTASDGKGGSADATLTLTITGVNDAPVVGANATKTINVVSNETATFVIDATDPDSPTPTGLFPQATAHGTLAVVNGKNVYTPNEGYVGADQIQVTLTDDKGATTTYTIAVNVTAPVIAENTQVAVSAAGSVNAAGDNFTYNFASGTYTYTIANFNDGDVLNFPDGVAPSVNNTNFADGIVQLTWASAGQVITVELTGLASADDASLFGVDSFAATFGAGTIA